MATSTWLSTVRQLGRIATDFYLDLPPEELDLPFLKLSYVLVELATFVYGAPALGSVNSFELPGSLAGACSTVTSELIHFRGAPTGHDVQGPQQFGIWLLVSATGEPVGLAIAFRGTAAPDDLLVNVNILPGKLDTSTRLRGDALQLHNGFYEGAKRHIDDIVAVIHSQNVRAGKSLPVWLTGHSLGGGYANCVMLHVLANKDVHRLFTSGGGSITFGAPMVAYAEDLTLLYKQLDALEKGTRGRGGRANPPRLLFHNYVNHADLIPRLLGCSLSGFYEVLLQYFPSLQAVHSTAKNYHPFGMYHIIHANTIHTISQAADVPPGSIGSTEYAQAVVRHLSWTGDLLRPLLQKWMSGTVVDHSALSYSTGIRSHLDVVAARSQQQQQQQLHIMDVASSIEVQEFQLFQRQPVVAPLAPARERVRQAARILAAEGVAVVGRTAWSFLAARSLSSSTGQGTSGTIGSSLETRGQGERMERRGQS